MDSIVFELMGGACYLTNEVGLGQVYWDFCLDSSGRTVLYYLIVGILIGAVFAVLGGLFGSGSSND